MIFKIYISDILENALEKYKKVLVETYECSRDKVEKITIYDICEYIDEFEYKDKSE